MSPAAGQLLISAIAPILAKILPRAVRPVGAEDMSELRQDALAQAAAILHAAERRGKTMPAQSVAYYVIKRVRSGRRSTGSSRTDVLAPGTRLQGRAAVESLDAPIESGTDGDDPTLHDLLADQRDDTDTAAARRMDWDLVTNALDDRRRAVLKATAEGYGTGEIAARYGVSAPRICQVRESIGRYIENAWGTDVMADAVREPGWKAGLRAEAERRIGRYERAHAWQARRNS